MCYWYFRRIRINRGTESRRQTYERQHISSSVLFLLHTLESLSSMFLILLTYFHTVVHCTHCWHWDLSLVWRAITCSRLALFRFTVSNPFFVSDLSCSWPPVSFLTKWDACWVFLTRVISTEDWAGAVDTFPLAFSIMIIYSIHIPGIHFFHIASL